MNPMRDEKEMDKKKEEEKEGIKKKNKMAEIRRFHFIRNSGRSRFHSSGSDGWK